MTDSDRSDSEIKRTEWSQGAFIEVWEDGEQKAAIPEREALEIGKAAGMVPIGVLEDLADELEESRIENTEKKQERDAKGDYEGMANYAGKEFAYFRAVEKVEGIINTYGDGDE